MSSLVFGIDYAWGRPGPAALKRAGARFVCRYVSHDTTGKDLTPAEAEQLSRAGLWLVVVWETTAARALSGRSGGTADARDADRKARACGMPADRPIYFAVDFDAAPAQQETINAYLDGAASVLGRHRVGLYGGYGPVKRALDAGRARWAWQTYAWSGGRWDQRAHIQQYSNGRELNGVSVDYNRAVQDDYGQWRVGGMPGPSGPAAPKWPGRYLRLRSPMMHGDDVRAWQHKMRGRGWRIEADGWYGAASANICRAFQKEKGLAADGVVGPDTWRETWEAPIE